MHSRRTKLTAIAAGVVALAGIGGGALASSGAANAATMNYPVPQPSVCSYKLGPNILKLSYLGNDYLYPVVLHNAPNGLVSGYLEDSGLPVGHQVLRVHGICVGSDLDLSVNYPTADPQGQRVEDMNITQVSTHRGTAAGNWVENGTEQGTGAASFVFQVFRP